MKTLLDKLRAKTTLTIMAKGQSIEEVAISTIPKNWEKFPDTEDLWININFPEKENTSSCLYFGKKGSIFKPHKHSKNLEHLIILNRKGKIKIVTDTIIKELNYPNAYIFNINEPHAIKFLEDTKLLVLWHPRMGTGWNANFIKEQL